MKLKIVAIAMSVMMSGILLATTANAYHYSSWYRGTIRYKGSFSVGKPKRTTSGTTRGLAVELNTEELNTEESISSGRRLRGQPISDIGIFITK